MLPVPELPGEELESMAGKLRNSLVVAIARAQERREGVENARLRNERPFVGTCVSPALVEVGVVPSF